MPGSNLNTLYCFGLDECGVATTIKRESCMLMYRKYDMSFPIIRGGHTNVLILTRIIPVSGHVAGNIVASKGIKSRSSNNADLVSSAKQFRHLRLAQANVTIMKAMFNH